MSFVQLNKYTASDQQVSCFDHFHYITQVIFGILTHISTASVQTKIFIVKEGST